MKIKLDERYILNSDPECFWLTEIIVSEKRKPYERRVSGYHRTFEMAVDSFIDKKIRELDVTKLSKVSTEIRQLKEVIRKWIADSNYSPNGKG
jgi:hypothetical protein